MNTYKYYIEYFDKEFAQACWQHESIKEPMSYREWLNSNGYSDCWSLHNTRFDSESKAIEVMIKDFWRTDSRTRRIIITGDGEDDWEMDSSYDSLEYPELEYRGDTYATN